LSLFFSDVDECTSASRKCHANANCVNTHGSYNCTCNPGYTGDGHNCTGETNNVMFKKLMITSYRLFGSTEFSGSPGYLLWTVLILFRKYPVRNCAERSTYA